MKAEKKSTVGADSTGITRSKSPLVCTVILLAVILSLLFWKVFNPSYVLFSNDGPLGGIVAEQNRMPSVMNALWENLNWLGKEDLSQSPAVSSILRTVVSPVMYAKLLCPISIFIAGICACFCFRKLKLAPLACVLGGLAAALNSDFFSTACWGVASQVIGFGAMYLAVGLLAEPAAKRQWIRVILAGFAVGVGVVEAYDIGALFSVIVAVFVMYQALFLREGAGEIAQNLGRGILRTILVSAFAALIAAHALTGLIGTQIAGISGTQQDEQTKLARWSEATEWSLPKIETLQVVVPGVFGYRDNWYMYENDSPTNDQYWGVIGSAGPGSGFYRLVGTGFYAGILVVLIAIWAILQSFRGGDSPFTLFQRRAIWFWSVILLVTLLLSFGKFAPFYQLFYALPYASTIRNPDKFMHIFSWAMVIIFAYGLHGLTVAYMQDSEARIAGVFSQFKTWFAKAVPFERKWMIGCFVAIGAGLLGLLVYSSSTADLKAYMQSVGISADDAPNVAKFSLHAVGWFVLILALSVGAMAMIVSGQFPGARAKWAGVLLGALLVFDLGRADAPWISYWDIDYKYAIDPVVQFLANKPYEHRVAMFPVGAANQQLALLQNAYGSDWKQHVFLYKDIQSADVIQEPRMPVDKQMFMNAIAPTNFFNLLRFWQLSNTRYLLGPGGDFLRQIGPAAAQFRIVQSFDFVPKRPNPSSWPEDWMAQTNANGQLAVLEYVDALPRAKLYSNWQPNAADKTTLQTLGDPMFDPRQMVMVADDIPAPAANNVTQSPGTVEINPNYKSKRVQLEADIKVPSVLMLTEKYNAKWQVEVDGQPAKLLRCDFIMRGVYLTPGKHEVVFRFVNSFTTLYISLAGIVLGLALWGFLIFDKPPDETPVSAPPVEPEKANPARNQNSRPT